MVTKMAAVDKAEELLEKLRSASWNAAVQGKCSSLPTNILVIRMFCFKKIFIETVNMF